MLAHGGASSEGSIARFYGLGAKENGLKRGAKSGLDPHVAFEPRPGGKTSPLFQRLHGYPQSRDWLAGIIHRPDERWSGGNEVKGMATMGIQ